MAWLPPWCLINLQPGSRKFSLRAGSWDVRLFLKRGGPSAKKDEFRICVNTIQYIAKACGKAKWKPSLGVPVGGDCELPSWGWKLLLKYTVPWYTISRCKAHGFQRQWYSSFFIDHYEQDGHLHTHVHMHACMHPSMHPCIHASLHPYIHTYNLFKTKRSITPVPIHDTCIQILHLFIDSSRVAQ